jgi:hypothetical protein
VDDDTHPDIVIELDIDDTRPHDAGEWLQGYRQGVSAGRKDVIGILDRILGRDIQERSVLVKVLEQLEAT